MGLGKNTNLNFRNLTSFKLLIGEFLKELDLTEGRSTGIPKILKVIAANGSPAPLFESDEDRLSFVIRLPVHPLARSMLSEATGEVNPEVTPEVTPEVGRAVLALQEELSRTDLQHALDLRDEKHFRRAYLLPALVSGLVEMTRPETPRSSKQFKEVRFLFLPNKFS